MTRHDVIAAHFKDGLTISPMEAFGLYQMVQLPAVILIMKERGWQIATLMRETRTGKRYARYVPLRFPDGTPVELTESQRHYLALVQPAEAA